MAPSKPVSYFNAKTPLEASSETKHPSDLSSLFLSLPHPSSPLHGHHHRLHFTPSSPFSRLNLCRLLTSPPSFFATLPPFFLALVSSHRFARLPVCLLRPVILTALLLLLPHPSVVLFPSPRLPFPSVPRSSWFIPLLPHQASLTILPFILLFFLFSTLSFSSLTKLFFLYILFFVL